MVGASAIMTKRYNSYRVSLVSTYPPEKCGVAYYTLRLARSTRNLVDLCVIANKTDNLVYNDRMVIKCWKKGSVFFPLSILLACIKSAGNVFHLQHHYALYGGALSALEFPLVLIILKIMNKPLVVTFHSIIPKGKLGRGLFERYGLGAKLPNTKKMLIVLITRSIVQLADAVIVHDSCMKDCLTRDYEANCEKTFVVPHGVLNVDSLDRHKAKSLIGFPDSRIILYQGFVTEGKGVEILIQAFEHVHKIFPETFLVIAGSFRHATDKYAQSINNLIMEKHLLKKVVVTGFVPEEDLPKYFSASDIIVLPYTERDILGTSEVLAEVALASKPVVATKTPKFLGLLRDGHNALLVDPSSVEQLATAILRVLSDEVLAKKLASALKSDASGRTWDKIGQATVEVYSKVLSADSAA